METLDEAPTPSLRPLSIRLCDLLQGELRTDLSPETEALYKKLRN